MTWSFVGFTPKVFNTPRVLPSLFSGSPTRQASPQFTSPQPPIPAPQVSAPQQPNPAPQPPILAQQVSSPIPVSEPVSEPEPVSASRKRRSNDEGLPPAKRIDLKKMLIDKIISCKDLSVLLKISNFNTIRDPIERFIDEILPGNIDSTLRILVLSTNLDHDIEDLALYVCRKLIARSVNYPGIGLEGDFKNQRPPPSTVLENILNSKNTKLTPNMVKKCVLNPSSHFECDLARSGIESSIGNLATNLASEFISAIVEDTTHPPFPCYSVGNYLYSIGPMIVDPYGNHIGRDLIMIRVLNYKNHIYPQGIYFWVYPSSSEGGLSRIFFKLPGGGSTYIKGTDYFSLSEVAVLESAINEFSIMAQRNAPITTISSYDDFVNFLNIIPHLQTSDIAKYLPSITVSNRYCYQLNLINEDIKQNFKEKPRFGHVITRTEQSIRFFRYIFDNGFADSYNPEFSPANKYFITQLKSLSLEYQPVCYFSGVWIPPPKLQSGTIQNFYWLFQNCENTQTLCSIPPSPLPHPNVFTLTGALSYVVGHRGNSFLHNMVSRRPYDKNRSSVVIRLLPPLPIVRLPTFGDDHTQESMASRTSRNRTEVNPVIYRDVLNFQSDETGQLEITAPIHTVLLNIRTLLMTIDGLLNSNSTPTLKIELSKLKSCILTFLGLPETYDTTSINNDDEFLDFIEEIRRKQGIKNISDLVRTSTYVQMMGADTLHTYLGVQPIQDVQHNDDQQVIPPALMVQISWLEQNHNYVPIPGVFEYNKHAVAATISNIFNSREEFKPYIIEARRNANALNEDKLKKIVNVDLTTTRVNGTIPVTVFTKTMLFRVILFNQAQDRSDPERKKFGGLEIIVSISSTASLTRLINPGDLPSLMFGTDVQFSVVSVTACHLLSNRDDTGHYEVEKFITFHGTNAHIESLGIWGTAKGADYAATQVDHDQYHPTISRFSRLIAMVDDTYNNLSISPYNTRDHWIMNVFAGVLSDLSNPYEGEEYRDRIFERWNWPATIGNFYKDKATPDVITQMTMKIKDRGFVLRMAAATFFSGQTRDADQADDTASSLSSTPSVPDTPSTSSYPDTSDFESDDPRDPNFYPDSESESGMDGGRRKPRVNKNKTIRKYKRYRVTNRQKQKSTNAKTKNKNKNIKTIKNRNEKRIGSNKSKPKTKPKTKPKPKSKSNLKCKRRMNTVTRRRCRT